MKKIILSMLILVLSLSLFFGVVTVYAEGSTSSSTESSTDNATELNLDNYYKIDDTVAFSYTNSGNKTISTKLPSGYWVEKISNNNIFTTLRYNGIDFMVSNDIFANMIKYPTDRLNPTSMPQHKVETVDIVYGENPSTYLYLTEDCKKASGTINSIVDTGKPDQLKVLNVITNSVGEKVYLVATKDNLVGFIKATTTTNPAIVITPWVNPGEKPVKPETPEISPDDDSEIDGEVVLPDTGIGESDSVIKPDEDGEVLPSKNNVVKIVLIVSICVLAAVLVFLIFKPTRQKRGRYSVDDDDDYDRDDSYNDRY